jgi:putative sigma-54 modulation protein
MTPLPVSVTARHTLTEAQRTYAEGKLTRLARHAHLHDISIVIDHESHTPRICTAEVVVHLHHVRLVARAEGATVQEAVDRAVAKADRQVLRRKDRVTHRKGHVGADGLSPGTIGETHPIGG